jgi:hypothetical protein
MKQLILTALIGIAFITNTNAQAKTKLPFFGKKYFTEEISNNWTYVITISKDGNCVIIGGGPGTDNKGIKYYKGKYKNKIVSKDGGFLFDENYLFLLDEQGNKRTDCMKMIKDEPIDCPCKYNLKTTKIE